MNIKLRTAREQSGKTQAQVAKEAGISAIMYQRYEYGLTRPRADTAILIAKRLNSSVEALFSPIITKN